MVFRVCRYFLSLLLAVPFVILACGAEKPKPIEIQYHKGVELAMAVSLLTPSGGEYQKQFVHPIRRDALNYFQKFKDHQAVRLCEKLQDEHGPFFVLELAELALYHSDPPELEKLYEYPAKLTQKEQFDSLNLNPNEAIANYIDALRKFYQDSNFERFWKKHLPEYEKIISTLKDSTKDIKIVEWVENYYGRPLRGYDSQLFFHL
jgi:hypothetical protein